MASSKRRATRPRIAAAGASGRVGSALVSRLVEDPVDLLALSRGSGATRLPSGMTLAVIDFDAPSALSRTLQELDRCFISQGTSNRQAASKEELIDAAVDAGISHLVKLSVMGYPILRGSTFVYFLARPSAQVAGGP